MSGPITFSGPHDAIKAGIATSGRDPVYFAAEAPNPRYNPDEYYTIRGVKKWWEKPTKHVAYVFIDLDSDGKSYFVGQAWTDEGFRRQGLIRRLYDMAWDYARSKGKGFQSGWVKSPLMAQYWEGMASQGRAEAYTDEWTRFNTTGKGWRRIKSGGRVAWAGGACNPNALSTAWITPDGDVIPVPSRQTHSEWANNHFADDEGYLEQRHSAPRYLTDTLGWVRLVNAYTMETGPRGASDRAMQAVVGILVDCVIARRDIDPETDTVTLGIGSSTRRPTIADFVAEFGTRQQSDALYEGLLSRQWGRTAASRPKYQGKKEVPKADGSGTTTVYQYGPRQVANRHRDKAERIEGLRKSIGDLRRRVKSDLKSDDAETRLTALGVALIDATYERVGNDESAGNGHYGVTGWTMDHVTLSKDGKRATFRYTGKSGVDHEKTVRDPDIVAAIRACCSDKGDDDHVLSEGDVRVTPGMVNDYLREFDVTAKDLRGFHANREVQERLRAIRRDGPDLPRPRKERDAILKREFKEALEAAAKAVGHEPSTLRNQYLVPWLEDAYMKDGTVIDRLDKRAARPPVDPRTATKTEAEREDDEATRLVRKTPKLKPSRDDSKRERMRVSDPDTSGRDRDLSLNYKDNG
jgi:DNA topoisomerase-1